MRGEPGFCDALVNLIGESVASMDLSAKQYMRLMFKNGVQYTLFLRAEDATGPELFQVTAPGMPIVVEQVA